jgi:hypothetical protein
MSQRLEWLKDITSEATKTAMPNFIACSWFNVSLVVFGSALAGRRAKRARHERHFRAKADPTLLHQHSTTRDTTFGLRLWTETASSSRTSLSERSALGARLWPPSLLVSPRLPLLGLLGSSLSLSRRNAFFLVHCSPPSPHTTLLISYPRVLSSFFSFPLCLSFSRPLHASSVYVQRTVPFLFDSRDESRAAHPLPLLLVASR